MAKILEIKDAIHLKTRKKEDIPPSLSGIYTRPHSTGKGIEFRLVNTTMGAKSMGVSLNELEPNMKTTTGIHSHKSRESAYIVLEGSATMHLNGTEHDVKPRMVIFIPPNEKHGMIRTGKNGVKFVNAGAILEPNLNQYSAP